jgi:hypothetical protein
MSFRKALPIHLLPGRFLRLSCAVDLRHLWRSRIRVVRRGNDCGPWFLEDSRWQISERIGTALIVPGIAGLLCAGRYQFFDLSISETMLPGFLARCYPVAHRDQAASKRNPTATGSFCI